MEQKVIKKCINEGERISALIDKITVDNEFVEQLFSTKNLEATLEKYEFRVGSSTLDTIRDCIEKLGTQTDSSALKKNEILVDKLINSLAIKAVISGNSAAGNWD